MININDMSQVFELQEKLTVEQWQAVKVVFELHLSNNQPEQAQSFIDGLLGLVRCKGDTLESIPIFGSERVRDVYFSMAPERLTDGLLVTVRGYKGVCYAYRWVPDVGYNNFYWRVESGWSDRQT